MTRQDKLVADVLAAAGGEIIGRIRLQKIFYLLDQAGLESGLTYHYHHYGPFSRDLDEAVGNAQVFEGVHEEVRYRQVDGMPYSVFTVPARSEADIPPTLGRLDAGQARELITTMKQDSATVLELAATIHWLAKNERVSDWKAELVRRKGPKTERGRAEKAVGLLEKLNLHVA
ncbi:MAG TPA: hypothetical protein VKS60_21020 [Stellaceae bacterium]|nr:hypothetical protein [Stellaceae bacterium]